MKFVDYVIISAVVVCCYVAYAGDLWTAAFSSALVITVASWRFWDQKRANEAFLNSAAGGSNLPEQTESDSDSALGDGGGHD
jgi:hypothetical protein